MSSSPKLKTSVYLGKCLVCFLLEMVSFLVKPFFKLKCAKIAPIKDKLLVMPAVELSRQIKSGKLSSEQVVQSFINQIKRVNEIINAVVDERFAKALDEARKIDAKLRDARQNKDDNNITNQSILSLPLVGVPLTVKETVSLKDSAFTAGLRRRKLKRASRSNPGVARLIEAGMVPIASTNTPCMNLWWDSNNLLYGRTDNPYDLSRIVGGSSGGEAAILAAAGSVAGVGSDLAGSIRIPANFCSVFGHKPTPFVVSNEGVFPAMREHQERMRAVGPMTRYACDLLPMLKAMAKESEVAKLHLDEPVNMKRLKIYYCDELGDPFASRCDKDILMGLIAAVEHFRAAYDVPVSRATFEEFKYGIVLWSAEMAVPGGHILAPEHEDGIVKFNPFLELFKLLLNLSEFPIGTIMTAIFERLAPRYGTSKHKYLSEKAANLRKSFIELVGDEGILLMPTHPQTAPHHWTTLFKFLNVSYTALANTLQAPITQCPLGVSREGLPYGVQVIAKPYNDRLCLAVAQELEKVFGGWLPPARVVTKGRRREQ